MYGLLGQAQFEQDQAIKGLESSATADTERHIKNDQIQQANQAARAQLGSTVGGVAGALGGAAVGAEIGEGGGPYGAAIGGVIGSLAGAFGAKL